MLLKPPPTIRAYKHIWTVSFQQCHVIIPSKAKSSWRGDSHLTINMVIHWLARGLWGLESLFAENGVVGLTAGLEIGKNVPYHTHSLAGTTKACEFVINVMPSNPSPKHPSICCLWCSLTLVRMPLGDLLYGAIKIIWTQLRLLNELLGLTFQALSSEEWDGIRPTQSFWVQGRMWLPAFSMILIFGCYMFFEILCNPQCNKEYCSVWWPSTIHTLNLPGKSGNGIDTIIALYSDVWYQPSIVHKYETNNPRKIDGYIYIYI